MTFGDFLKVSSFSQGQELHISGIAWTFDHKAMFYNVEVNTGNLNEYFKLCGNKTAFKRRYRIKSIHFWSYSAPWEKGKRHETIFIDIDLPKRIQKKLIKEGLAK